MSIKKRAKEARLRWYDHVLRTDKDNSVKVPWRDQVNRGEKNERKREI